MFFYHQSFSMHYSRDGISSIGKIAELYNITLKKNNIKNSRNSKQRRDKIG